MTKPRDLNLTEMQAALSNGELSAVELAESCLEAVEAYDETLHAFIFLDRNDVLAQCRAVDAQPREERAPLAGIPIAVKDLIDDAGWRTTAGSSLFRDAPPATADAPIVQRLRAKIVAAARELAKRVDAWILPTTPRPALRIGQPFDPTLAFFTGPVDTIGLPTIAVPSGLSAEGLPVSIQLVGGPCREKLLLEIAGVLEERLAFPPSLPTWVASHGTPTKS